MPATADRKLQGLSPREQTRLAGILARLSSPFEAERATAGLLASEFMARHDLAWSDLTGVLRQRADTEATAADPEPQPRRRPEGPCRSYGKILHLAQGRTLDLFT
jgi:hypothetical protein